MFCQGAPQRGNPTRCHSRRHANARGPTQARDRATSTPRLHACSTKQRGAHHVAYAATEGVDPDWSIWYAGHLLEKGMEDLPHARLLKSDLIYLLVMADKERAREAPGGRWERYHADFFVRRYLK